MNQKFFGSFFQKRTPSLPRLLIVTADDFGLSPVVNEAVEIAARDGILTSASLMVGAAYAPDAVRRAQLLAGRLRVGLHLVVIEGPAVLPRRAIPDLVDDTGHFPAGQLRLGLRYAFLPRVRRQLAAEIAAQFEAFRATGLTLDHANAHKHMHLHPVIGRMMISIGRGYGLRAVRIPCELPRGPGETWGSFALRHWTRLLRRQAGRAGMGMNDQILGLRESGRMEPARVQELVDGLLPGVTELYVHPATESDDIVRRTMPAYRHAQELRSLLDTTLPADVRLTSYGDLGRQGER